MGIDRDVARGCYRTIADTFDADGKFYFEMLIRPWSTRDARKTWCDMAIHLTEVDRHSALDLLVGIEVKDWADPVPPSVIKDEFEGYRYQFDYFYFAANEYAPSVDVLDIRELGRIDMSDGFEIIESPRPQPTVSWNRRKFIEALERNWKQKRETLIEQYPDLASRIGESQREVDEFDGAQRTLGETND